MFIDLVKLQKEVRLHNVTRRQHPIYPIYIYNYTPQCEFDRNWNDVNINCRGLILDEYGNLISRPFPKFFNLEQTPIDKIPDPETIVCITEKLDGSLGILYIYEGQYLISTRGDFESEQAAEATKILHEKYSHVLKHIDNNYTYLFEIIYPENRIVVNYNDLRDLILIGVVEKSTGRNVYPLPDIGFPIAKSIPINKNFQEILALDTPNQEGYVVLFENGQRIKLKFATYKLIHKIKYQFSESYIWEHLSQEKSIYDIIDGIPDEFTDEIKQIAERLTQEFNDILKDIIILFSKVQNLGNVSRKEQAIYITTNYKEYAKELFALLDKKPITSLVWKRIKP